jgi:hypothetical protein
MKTFEEANQVVHKVEDEWHYPILTKHGFEPVDKTGVGFVRQFLYKKGGHTIKMNTGVHCDYWADLTVTGGGYWASLEPHLKTLSN